MPTERKTSRIPVEVATLRAVQLSIVKASKAVHSDARMHANDKKYILFELSKVKKTVAELLQLTLFSPDQLEP